MADGTVSVETGAKPSVPLYTASGADGDWSAASKVQRSTSTSSDQGRHEVDGASPFSPTTPEVKHGNGVLLVGSPTQVPDQVHNLPMELLQAGWRRFWSQRESREYFYNKLTRESKWEMPLLPGQIDPISDPLGISSPNPVPTVSADRRLSLEASVAGPGGPSLKRAASEEASSLVPPKRPFFAPRYLTVGPKGREHRRR